MEKVKARWKKIHQAYGAFIEKQGFFVVLAVCVAVIVGTAVWSGGQGVTAPEPTSPVDEQAALAGRMQQERLQDVSTLTPSPTEVVRTFAPPLAQVRVVQGFDAARLRRSGAAGLWQLHDACDLAAETGEKVLAMADGTVLAVRTDSTMLCQVTVQHGDEIVAQYAGMTLTAALQAGDPVSAGQTIGFAGKGPLAEQDMEPHLHLRVTRKGKAVDPTLLWK